MPPGRDAPPPRAEAKRRGATLRPRPKQVGERIDAYAQDFRLIEDFRGIKLAAG